MEEIIVKNKYYKKKFDAVLSTYSDFLAPHYLSLVKIVIIRFKKYSDNEYFVVLALKYALYFFKIVDLDDPIMSKKDRKNIKEMTEVYEYTLGGEYEKYVHSTMELSNDLLLFKVIIKSTILQSEDHYMKIISNTSRYYKSCGYMIPYLTWTESRLLPFFQDIYFKKIYPKEYKETKKADLQKGNSYEIPGGYHIEVVNDLSYLMKEAWVIGQTQIRKKTFFSLYNKMQRKNSNTISNSIGVRIIFNGQADLYKFINIFESKFVYISKKDYIINPKPNGYKSIHYKYINPYRNGEVLVELQLRTLEIDNNIQKRNEVSHFTYTTKEHKWAPLFTEVHDGHKYMLKYMEEKQIPQK
ncbi:bifunctional (p)ppGpp synthetase/guanosine-3',5'-bis(diphosphate) 3'-pyrophosphohydrolase [Candidatus Gracilibacteria bacterium 28_42_T64]|nr:bifunctional (p)ppGpp synthetase/guanosine-3',5'-bis(diphosphate) 3'-pyrophosphohydrolase [Candidatus Gracilibacteria bacterium 28_42_T64]